jgi:hypothetical protein
VNIKRFMSKKVVAIGLAAGITLGLGGAAFAYFTAAGSGTAAASVGSGAWGIVQDGAASGLMYPGQGTSTVTYTITNLSKGNQELAPSALTASMYSYINTGDVESNGSDVAGCLAQWFDPIVGTPSPGYGTSIAAGGTVSVNVTVTMSDPGVNQDVCEGVSPVVSLAASA